MCTATQRKKKKISLFVALLYKKQPRLRAFLGAPTHCTPHVHTPTVVRFNKMNNTSTKVVFLDCDGVVSPFSGQLFQKAAMQQLKRVIDTTGAKIVLSSSWRTTEFGRNEVMHQLVRHGMPSFMACTPSLADHSRAEEILAWVQENKAVYNIVNFVALDDMDLPVLAPDRAFFRRHTVVTDPFEGLTEAKASEAIAILTDENNI